MSTFRLTDIVVDHAREHGEGLALTFEGHSVSYAELERRSGLAAAAMMATGLGTGSRVVWLGKNRPEFFELLFAVPRLRAAVAPLNIRLTSDELATVADDAAAELVVLGPDAAEMRDRLATDDRRVVVVGEDYETWRDASSEPAPPSAESAEDDAVLQLYTSGTTGTPKGVLLSHANFSVMRSVGEHWVMDTESVALAALPLFHIGGSGFALACLFFGARVVLVADIVPDQLLDLMEREGVTNTFLVPSVLHFLTQVPGAADRDWSALRAVAYGASPITGAVLDQVISTFRAPLFQVYGSTETTGAICQLEPDDHDPDGPRAHLMRSAGRPYPWVELCTVDPDTGRDTGPDEVGEIWIRGRPVTSGYWHRPEETGQAITDNGWFRSGDAGYLDDEGYLFITDRIKDMIVSGGENIYPIEVEDVVAGHPDVADVAVIGVPDETWGEAVKAVIVPAEGATIDEDGLLAWVKERIAGYKRPRTVDVVDELPRNATGKLLKKDLRSRYWQDHDRAIG